MSANQPPYLSLTDRNRESMLQELPASREDLSKDIPESLQHEFKAQEEPLSERAVRQYHANSASLNETVHERTCFRGGGFYDHSVPSPVLSFLQREEFLTSYTPYQAEVNQGSLQAMFEYQSLLSTLTELPVTNASLYDGATAYAEALLMATAVTDRDAIYYSPNLWSSWIEVMRTYAEPLGWELIELPSREGRARFPDTWEQEPAAVAMMYPNRWGNSDAVADWEANRPDQKTVGICGINPLALGVLSSPGELGWDVAVGEGQPVGLPLNAGGPDLGIFSARERFLRHMPGRLVGVTEDQKDQRCFVLTLQTREQHIRRERATSNICTNHALLAIGAAVALASLGREGFRNRSVTNARHGKQLADRFQQAGLQPVGRPVFNEVTVELPDAAPHLDRILRDRGWLGGIRRGNRYTCAATEKRDPQQISEFVEDVVANVK